jgi:hypothetical protein
MALTTSYLSSTKNLNLIFNSLLGAKAPERFTIKFLEDLGFKSSSDRLYIGMFKALGLLDENSAPTKRYYDFLDQSQSRKIVAIGLQEAYGDLFNLRTDAQNMTKDEVKNKLKTLTQGKGDAVIEKMATTFKAFASYADWSEPVAEKPKTMNAEPKEEPSEDDQSIHSTPNNSTETSSKIDLCYNIQVHLPETTNMAVYDAIFSSLRKHLL